MLTLLAGKSDEQMLNADSILSGWQDYCDLNWLNDNGEDMFPPEVRVKRFLDSIGYYLLYGNTDGIVTEYKEVVNQAREIPVSSCPGSVNNIFYASGGSSGDVATEEKLAFRIMTELLDERANSRKKPRAPVKKSGASRRRKMYEILEENDGARMETFVVDTDGCFHADGRTMNISGVREYEPKTVRFRNGTTDTLYDMDRVLRCGNRWYDMNGNPIPEDHIREMPHA